MILDGAIPHVEALQQRCHNFSIWQPSRYLDTWDWRLESWGFGRIPGKDPRFLGNGPDARSWGLGGRSGWLDARSWELEPQERALESRERGLDERAWWQGKSLSDCAPWG